MFHRKECWRAPRISLKESKKVSSVRCAGAFLGDGPGCGRAPSYRWPLSRGAIVRTVTATGTVNRVLAIIVGSYVSGVIQQLFCDFNTKVTQAQICAKIDPKPYQAIVDQDKANLANARAQLNKDNAALAYAASVRQSLRAKRGRERESRGQCDWNRRKDRNQDKLDEL